MSFTANMSGVSAKIRAISTNQGLGQFLAETAAAGMDKYVPYRTGQLASSVSTRPFSVHYGADYARSPFYGEHMTFRKDQHPLARARWDRGYAEASGEALGKAGTQYLRSNIGH